MHIDVGQLLKKARETADIQQKDVAAAAGMLPSRLSRIESGQIVPERAEIMALAQAIGADEGEGLAEDLQHDFKHVLTPHWMDLRSQERQILRQADTALEKLLRHRGRPEFPKTLVRYAGDIEDKLRRGIRYLTLVDHKVVFVGPIGVGKSTVINSIFGLMLPPRKGGSKLSTGLLPVGSGRVTAFEYRIAWGAKTLILIEPESETVIRNDVRNLCEYWLAEAHGAEKPPRPLPEELERVYRNMAGLTESEGEDPARALITPEIAEWKDLFSIVMQKINLPARKRVEISYDSDLDRDASEPELEWIRRRLRQINFGKLPEFSVPKGLTLVINNPRLKSGGYSLTIVDTRGLDENVSREDLAVAESDPYALCVLCSGFKDAPTRSIMSEIERAQNRRFETLEKRRFALLVLPQRDEATQFPNFDTDDSIDEAEGYRRRNRQVQKALGAYADDVPVMFYNAGGADSADDILSSLAARICEIRDFSLRDLTAACASVDLLIDQQAEIEFSECQREVRAKFEFVRSNYNKLEHPLTPIHARMIDEILRCHASSIYSATRYSGEGRTVNFYHLFNMQIREVAVEMATPAVSGLRTLLQELGQAWDTKRPDSRQARAYVSDLITMIDLKLREFVERAEAVGDVAFRPAFEEDGKLWQDCLMQRGLGSGYRDRVGRVITDWFREHRDVLKKVDREIEKAWTSTFVAWAKEVSG